MKVCSILILLTALLSGPANGALTEISEIVKSKIPVPEIEARSWVLADFETGWILGSENADSKIEPASLTKLMTSFLVFSALGSGEIAMDDRVYVSKKAWETGGSKMFIQVDTKVAVSNLVQGLIVQSGNDAAVALAEHIGGTEEGFVSRMNRKAAEIGMTNTHFTNSSGLSDENHYSTAKDMTILASALIRNFPDLYRYYSQREFTYNGITQHNRNILLDRDPAVDGLKTGYTRNAGYCLIGTAVREGVRMIATVTGAKSETARANQVRALLQFGYDAYDGMVVYKPGDIIKRLQLWMGRQSEASIGVNRNLGILVPKGNAKKLSAVLELPDSLDAPLAAGTRVGEIQIKYDGKPFYKTTLHANETYREGSWFSQISDAIKRFVH